MTKRISSALLAVVVLAGAGACAKRDTVEKKVLRFIDRTEKLSNRYVYQEAVAGQSVTVRGLVEDDFRFKARLTLNDNDILDEVVNDDALAVRFLDPSVLPQFVKNDPSASGTSALEVLAQRQWVVDPAGAPPVGLALTDERFAGVDPVVDSLAVLAYARQAVTEADGAVKFNVESVDYRPAEDPFPTPKAGSGIERYDIVLRKFPQTDTIARTGNIEATFATVSQFRKMSLYVKDNRVIQVRERIAAEGKILEKFSDYLKAAAKQAGGGEAEKRVTQITDRFEGEQRAQLLLQLYNLGLTQVGRAPIRFRSMTYELRDLGANVEVGLPTGAQAKLDTFGVNAVQEQEAATAASNAARSGAAGSASSSTTTTAGAAP